MFVNFLAVAIYTSLFSLDKPNNNFYDVCCILNPSVQCSFLANFSDNVPFMLRT